MTKSIKVGCCGFGGSQEQYYKRFNVVEVQQTFYDPPEVKTLERWRQKAPADFEFTIKAWQIITHRSSSPTYKRMRKRFSESELQQAGFFRNSEIVWRGFEKTIECALTLNASAIVFQCPASFKPSKENIDKLCCFFSKAFEMIPHNLEKTRFVWEPRGDWGPEIIKHICDKFRLIDCVDIFARRPVTAEEFYIRLHGGKDYSHAYTDAELDWLKKQLDEFDSGYCMFNNVSMLEDAQRFLMVLKR
ncbi:MAG: DUF72 domain-containing protein [Verrucomicrobiia bacterium]